MKTAIITGASSGMGKIMAYRLCDFFADIEEIWVIARRAGRLAEFKGRVPAKVNIMPLDLKSKEGIKAFKDELKAKSPEVVALVNAAGYGKAGPCGRIKYADAVGMVELNDLALTAVTEAALPYMARGGRIIQFSSAAAFVPQPGFSVYAASKSYVLSYSRALAFELKSKGITVTAVCPGPVSTEFFGIALEGKPLGFIKRLVMTNPEKVVDRAIRDSIKGRDVCIPTVPMKLFYVLCKIMPHMLIMSFMNWK